MTAQSADAPIYEPVRDMGALKDTLTEKLEVRSLEVLRHCGTRDSAAVQAHTASI